MSARLKLLLLAAVLVAPSVLAYVAYSGLHWRPPGQRNYGELLTVPPLADAAGGWRDGAAEGLARTRGKWLLVYVGPAACDAACRQSVFLMRQARILQDAARRRVELLWVPTDAAPVDAAVLQAHPELQVWRPADPAFVHGFGGHAAGAANLYVVDPLGRPVLRFPAPPDARRMVKDIKLLLQASQIG